MQYVFQKEKKVIIMSRRLARVGDVVMSGEFDVSNQRCKECGRLLTRFYSAKYGRVIHACLNIKPTCSLYCEPQSAVVQSRLLEVAR